MPATKKTFDLAEASAPAYFMDTLPHVGSNSSTHHGHDVIVVHQDGEVLFMDEKLDNELWRKTIADVASQASSPGTKENFEYATIVDVEAVRQGLLQGRSDIFALFGVDEAEQLATLRSSKILVLISSCTPEELGDPFHRIHILTIQQRSADGLTSNAAPVRHLLSWDLPTTRIDTNMQTPECRTQYSLHASAGVLHLLDRGAIITYDLTGIVPKFQSTLNTSEDPCAGFLRISPNVLLAISANTCGIYGIRYNSTQDVQPFGIESLTPSKSKKRKRLSEHLLDSFTFTTFFRDSETAVGISANELVALQLKSAREPGKRPKMDGVQLIDAIGRGTRRAAQHRAYPANPLLPAFLKATSNQSSATANEHWERISQELDTFASQGDVAGFEKVFAILLGIPLSPNDTDTNEIDRKVSVNGKPNGTKVNGFHPASGEDGESDIIQHREDQHREVPPWAFPPHVYNLHGQTYRTQALFALGKIFAWTSNVAHDDESGLETSFIDIRFFPPNVFKWLVLTRYLTADLVAQALRAASTTPAPLRNITTASLVSAIVRHDPELHNLHTILTQPSRLDVEIIIQAIKVLIQSLVKTPLAQISQRLLPAPPEDDMEPTKLDRALVSYENDDIDSHLALASADLDYAETALEGGLLVRAQALRHALLKLHAFPKPMVTRMLRNELSSHELTFFIQMLRIELQDGGWIRRYIDADPVGQDADGGETEVAYGPTDSAMAIVAELLSCAIDAMGLGGWLYAGAAAEASADADLEDDPNELLRLLRLEISAALEGILETNFIRGFLNEELRYAERVKQANPQPHFIGTNKHAKQRGERTRPVTVVDDGTVGLDAEAAAMLKTALPLGLRAENARVDKTKVVSGGEIRTKSRRQMGMEISKRVGRYTFERIRV